MRAGDYVNLGLARAKRLPVVVIGDIDRGGVFASLYGTVALLDDDDRQLITAFLINKFRGDLRVLQPGLDELTRRTGAVRGVPWLPDVWLDAEDTLEVAAWRVQGSAGALRVAVVRLPRLSNGTDVEALAAESGVEVLVTTDVTQLLVLILCTARHSVYRQRSGWLRRTGLAEVIESRYDGAPVLGICGGYQMLARVIDDSIESASGTVDGLGLLPIKIRFEAEKVLRRPTGTWQGHQVEAYEIHHGIAELEGEAEPFLDGWRRGQGGGPCGMGLGERRLPARWLAEIAAAAGSPWRPDPDAPAYRLRRETMINTLADAVEEHVDLGLLLAGTRVAGPAVTIQAVVIGIGSGDPDHLTREAVAALNRVDVFVVADKGRQSTTSSVCARRSAGR